MVYLTYAEYLEYSQKVSQSDFPMLERMARRKLDVFTHDRLKTATTIIDEVKELMTIFIDKMSSSALNGNITSYSNGVESFGFGENQTKALDNELYNLAIEYLPVELISSYVG